MATRPTTKALVGSRFVTKELSRSTWRDYERFFSREGYGWNHCACTAYQGVRVHRGSFADQRIANLAVKCDLVNRGLAHGILVYDAREPIGWCQFGLAAELPIPRKPVPASDTDKPIWRVTCFCTVKEYREQGVTEVALSAVLDAIARAGGGLVRAAPVASLPSDQELDDLIRAHGSDSKIVLARAQKVYGATSVVGYDRRAWSVGGVSIRGLKPAWALVRKVPSVEHTGTISMFQRQGFKPTALIPPGSKKLPMSRLVMERRLRAKGGRA